MLWLSEGDAPTKFLHIQASSCCWKNFIHFIEYDRRTLVDEHNRAEAIFGFFDDLMGSPPTRGNSIILDLLHLPHLELPGFR